MNEEQVQALELQPADPMLLELLAGYVTLSLEQQVTRFDEIRDEMRRQGRAP